MKRIDTRLEALEIKAAAAQMESRGYCNCPVETIIKDPVALDELPGRDNHATKYKPRTTGTCPRCGGKYSKDHPEPPIITIQPVKATPQGDR